MGERRTGVGAWSDAAKVAAVSALALPFLIGWLYRTRTLLGDPTIPTYADRQFLPLLEPYLCVQIVAHVVLIAAAGFRRGRRRDPVLVHVEVQVWVVSQVLALYALGPFTTSMGVMLLAVPVIGSVVFDRAPVNAALCTLMIGLTLVVVLPIVGVLPYAPFMARAPFHDGRLETPWLLSFGLPSLFVAALAAAIHYRLLRRLHDRQRELEELSNTDPLTGLANRTRFFVRLADEIARARRYQVPLTVVMIDVDHFKEINDGYGHLIGDRVLRDLGAGLRDALRAGDLAARYGGEEFVVLLPHTGIEAARAVAERLRAVPRAVHVGDGPGAGGASASLGVAALAPSDDADALIARADAALYAAKHRGRDQVVIDPGPAP